MRSALGSRSSGTRLPSRSRSAIRSRRTSTGTCPTAVREDGVELPVEQMQVRDRVVVRRGEKIATDGRVVHGAAAVDVSMLTGESVPVDVEAGDEVFGATLNTSGRLLVETTKVGSE